MTEHFPDKANKQIAARNTHKLWERYKATNDLKFRNQLVMTLSPLVRYIVYRKVRELPARCDVDDFVSCGWEALIQAIERYNPKRGTTIEQFAWTRVQGAVIDELRRQDWAPRSLRRRERELGRVRDAFAAQCGRPPTDTELAAELDLPVERIRSHQQALEVADVGSLNAVVSGDDGSMIERIETIVAEPRGTDPELAAEVGHAKGRFRQAFKQLSEREQKVAVMLYASERTLREIGAELGVSESRICQIHSELKRRLRVVLGSENDLFAAVGG